LSNFFAFQRSSPWDVHTRPHAQLSFSIYEGILLTR
jgi:hypothetical protein